MALTDLPRTAFAHDGNSLARVNGIVDPVDGAHGSATGAKLGAEIPDIEQRRQRLLPNVSR